jgi:hypothetical protein
VVINGVSKPFIIILIYQLYVINGNLTTVADRLNKTLYMATSTTYSTFQSSNGQRYIYSMQAQGNDNVISAYSYGIFNISYTGHNLHLQQYGGNQTPNITIDSNLKISIGFSGYGYMECVIMNAVNRDPISF